MATVIGVRFKKAGKVYYFDPSGVWPNPGQYVVVETARGIEMGEVVTGAREVSDDQIVAPLKKVIRMAVEEDVQRAKFNETREKEAFRICQERITQHKLEMKLVDVEYTFDNSKIIFYFTANGRVDFRELVKDLASVFKMRIELRQIGVRDEAKMLGGLGSCGRPICCGTFLGDFQPVSIKMAKEQNLSLNPTKISGQCGRLMCCLKYEADYYEAALKKMPRVGREALTPDGVGIVADINVLREKVRVRMRLPDDTFDVREYALEDVKKVSHPDKPDKGEKQDKGEKMAEDMPQDAQKPEAEKAAKPPKSAKKDKSGDKAARDEASAKEASSEKEKPQRRRIAHPKGPKQANADQYFDKLANERKEKGREKPQHGAQGEHYKESAPRGGGSAPEMAAARTAEGEAGFALPQADSDNE